MEWKDIVKYHRNPPTHRMCREDRVQYEYEMDKQTEDELYDKLFVNGSEYVFTINKYPYKFIDNTEHHLFWSKGPVDYGILENVLKGLNKKYVYFENHSNNKSIKTINHVHVFLN